MTESRPLRGTTANAAAAHVASPAITLARPFTSLAENTRATNVRNAGNSGSISGSAAGPTHAWRSTPTSLPRGPAPSMSGDPNASSSLALSSDTALLSPDVPPLSAATFGLAGWEASPTRYDSPSPTLYVQHRAAHRPPLGEKKNENGCHEEGGARTATSQVVPPAASSSFTEPRCSIDFSHEVEARAEAELQRLWTSLWTATHSMRALEEALASPRLPWNPYRPARGGPEVREEVLHSEVADFQDLIPMDSLCLHGKAIRRPACVTRGGLAEAPPPLAHTIRKVAKKPSSAAAATQALQKKKEEVLVLDSSAVHCGALSPLVSDSPSFTPQRQGGTPPSSAAAAALAETREMAHCTEAWWMTHRADAEAALLRYLWASVVVPFYVSKPCPLFRAPFSASAVPRDTERPEEPSVTTPLLSGDTEREDRDEKDMSGLVTAFGPTRDDMQKWSLDSITRSTEPPLGQTSPLCAEGAPWSWKAAPHTRLQRSGGGGIHGSIAAEGGAAGPLPSYPSPDVDVASDDSLEVEVLDDSSSNAKHTREALRSPPVAKRQVSASPPRLPSTRRNKAQRHQRPSTADVHAALTSALDDNSAGRGPLPATRHGGGGGSIRSSGGHLSSNNDVLVIPVSSRARSARSNDTSANSPHKASISAAPSKITDTTGRTKSTVLWAEPQPLPASRAVKEVKASLPAKIVKAAKGSARASHPATPATRQRPPTAQPPPSSSVKKPRMAPPSDHIDGATLRGTASPPRDGSNGPPKTRVANDLNSRQAALPSSAKPAHPQGPPRASDMRTQRPPRQQRHQQQHQLPLKNGSSGAVNHALRLLELQSRSTSRSPVLQSLPSPITAFVNAGSAEALRGNGAAAQRVESAEGPPPLRQPQRHGLLAPVSAVLSSRKPRRRRLGSGQQRTEEDEYLSGPLSTSHKSRLAPLREVVAHSATAQDRPTGLEAQKPMETATKEDRTSSVGARRSSKQRSLRSTSSPRKASQYRPTTAQH